MANQSPEDSTSMEFQKPLSASTPYPNGKSAYTNSSLVASVILINYNQGHYLVESLNSIMNQTYPHIEIIVIDGGSSDNSVEILTKYPGIKWTSESDNSSGHAFAKGVNLATGSFVYFLASSDGFFDNEWIENSVNLLRLNPHISLVSADVIGIDQNSTLNGYKWPKGKIADWSNKELFFSWLLRGVGITPITFAIKKDVLNLCAPSINQMQDPHRIDSVDYFWHLAGNFFSSGFIGIKISMVSSFVRFHEDRVDDAAYLLRQRNQLHRLIINHRRQFILSFRPATFVSPLGEIVKSHEITYLEVVWRILISKPYSLYQKVVKSI
jgi:glycosyltransferase involved in cell wall biosynthesis